MLVLSRKVGEKIHIGDNIVVTLTQIRSPTTAAIGIEAPPHVRILREELPPENEGPYNGPGRRLASGLPNLET